MSQTQSIVRALGPMIEGDVFEDMLHRVAFSTDASIYRIVPACVVVPRCTEDVVTVVKYAAQEGIPVAPRGAGSGVAGERRRLGLVFAIATAALFLGNLPTILDELRHPDSAPAFILTLRAR